MSNTVEQLKSAFETFLAEDAKFTGGNKPRVLNAH